MYTTTLVPKNYHTKIPACMVLYMEEGVVKRVKEYENKIGSYYFRKKAHMAVFSDPNYNIVYHTCCPEE